MKIKISQKDIIGYLFLLLLAAVCMIIGVRVLAEESVVSGIFGLVLGFALLAAAASMVLRKE